MDDAKHKEHTGESNGLILDNLKFLTGKGGKVNIRIPLIPGITDTDQNLDEIRGFISSLQKVVRISLLPYNQFGEDKRRRFDLTDRLGNLKPQRRSEIEDKATRFRSLGCEVKIGG
jgi:pyruvate formate lyase activating enzyme